MAKSALCHGCRISVFHLRGNYYFDANLCISREFTCFQLLKSGYLIATIQMAAKRNVAQRFKCIIEVKGQRGADHRYVHNMKVSLNVDALFKYCIKLIIVNIN